jgi:hypothetical protein
MKTKKEKFAQFENDISDLETKAKKFEQMKTQPQYSDENFSTFSFKIEQEKIEFLIPYKIFVDGIQLITSIRNNMKNSLMTMSDKILLRKRSVIETVND